MAERVKSILKEIKSLGSEEKKAGMSRFAINVGNAFGVSVYDIRALAKKLGTDHALAQALWKTGNHEARLLACFVDDPALVTAAQAEAWAQDFDSWDICDQATTSLMDISPIAWQKAREWATRDEEWVKRGGFALMAGLAVHDKKASDADFIKLFGYIEKAAFDPRNFVKKAVNWALRNIGKRNSALKEAAIECALRIQSAAGKPARPANPDASAARWVASDALRELTRLKKK